MTEEQKQIYLQLGELFDQVGEPLQKLFTVILVSQSVSGPLDAGIKQRAIESAIARNDDAAFAEAVENYNGTLVGMDEQIAEFIEILGPSEDPDKMTIRKLIDSWNALKASGLVITPLPTAND